MRVFRVLDGKPEADYRQGCYVQLGAVFRTQTEWPKSDRNDYFELRPFRNGNGHLCFKRLELVMNAIIARHPSRAAKLRSPNGSGSINLPWWKHERYLMQPVSPNPAIGVNRGAGPPY